MVRVRVSEGDAEYLREGDAEYLREGVQSTSERRTGGGGAKGARSSRREKGKARKKEGEGLRAVGALSHARSAAAAAAGERARAMPAALPHHPPTRCSHTCGVERSKLLNS